MTISDVNKPYNIAKFTTDTELNYVRYPFEIEIFSRNKEAKLQDIKRQLEGGSYAPGPMGIANSPKVKGAVRPIPVISFDDQVAYTMIVESIYPKVYQDLVSLQGVSDFAYQLRSPDKVSWFRYQYNCWDDFKQKSLDQINNGRQFAVITDVTGCYENIDINILIADLRRIGAPTDTITMLRKFLKKWSQTGSKGIPQSIAASHVLAKIYMSSVDIELRNAGYRQFRFVDDIRVFCDSIPEAKRALMKLTEILRRRGLNLQSSKSKILQADEARKEIAGKASVIDALHERLRIETDVIEIDEYPYAIEMQINTGIPNADQLNIIKQAFRDYFLLGDDADFDKSLFHYLLNKLGNASDDIAMSYCLDLLEIHPEETKSILSYLSKLTDLSIFCPQLIIFLESENAIYDYQNYLIVDWLLEHSCNSESFLNILRRTAFDNNKPSYYRAIARRALGATGDYTDLNRIKDTINDAPNIQEKQATICSVTRLEPSVRNSFFSDTSSSDPNLAPACDYARSL